MRKSPVVHSMFSLLILGAFLAPPAAAKDKQARVPKYRIHWLLGHKNLDYFEEAAQNFKTAVEARSGGEIAVDIVTAKDEASETSAEIAARVAKGDVEMGHSFVDVMGGLDPRLYAFEAPFLFRDYRHMEGVIEGPAGAELLDGLRAKNIVGLSFTYSGGACGVASVGREIRRPEDLKGLRVGVYGDEVNAAWLTSLGATPVPIGHRLESIVPLASGGRLDAVVSTWRNAEREDLDQRFKSMSMMGSTYLVSVTYANDKFFDGLPARYRTLLKEESQKAGRIERARTIELNETAKLTMLGKGMRAVHLSAAERSAFLKAVEPAYARAIERILGKVLIDRIRKTSDAPALPSVLASR